MPRKRTGVAAWVDWLATAKIESLFVRPRVPGPPRSIYVNQELPADYFDHKGRVKREHVYCTNQVITSKYTIVTFFPRNLLEQFRRVANVFFLGIAILQFFPIFPTVSPGLVILPLLIVLAITGLKDGYEDVKRHQADRAVNHSVVRVLSGGGWQNPNAMAAKDKTFVKALPGLNRPKKGKAKAGAESHTADLEAAELEHGAPLEAIPTHTEEYDSPDEDEMADRERGHGLFHHGSGQGRPHWRHTNWEDVRVGDFVKIVDDESFPADILICATSEDENVAFVETKNLDGETNLKSRSASAALTHLRTASVCADPRNAFRIDCDRPDANLYKLNAAVVVGDEKMSVDAQNVLLRGTILRNTRWVIGVVLYTGEDAKIVMNSSGAPSKRSKVERQMNPQVFINLLLLAGVATVCAIADSVLEHRYYPRGAPWLYADDQSNNNPSVNGVITWCFALITFQDIIPISLYISFEVVRTCQALFIYFDYEMHYKKTDQPTLARNWTLSDDLGQIEYIFSDKTGTLTQNAMVFRRCSVAGRAYMGLPEDEPEDTGVTKVGMSDVEERTSTSSGTASGSRSHSKDPRSATTVAKTDAADTVKLAEGVLAHFHDTGLAADITAAVHGQPGSEEATRGELMNAFFSTLALCHTALCAIDPMTHAIEYKAQSPDEAALVQAAADVGFVFRGREREVLTLQTPFANEYEHWELLNILEFNSARKRMSVLVRKKEADDHAEERILLLTKGADNVIFDRLAPNQEELMGATGKDLDGFAGEGLRTLTLAYRVVADDEYDAWNKRFLEATVALDEREAKVDAVYEEIEHSLQLLGATAIEDRLQDGVPETIADLKEAGIKIWVATGDKLETAIAIGHSTNLIGADDNIIVVRGPSGDDDAKSVYTQLLSAAAEFFPDSGISEEEGAKDEDSAAPQGNGAYPLARLNTNATSLVGHGNGERPGGYVLVIDGAALADGLADDRHKRLLLRLAMLCEGVICCRVSPSQKAEIVLLVKDALDCTTLAIGDGANDVSMIQAADIGIGISGEEGLQAVNASDYAIAQFRFLKRLLLVHGHWSYYRNSNMILNFFYKNIIDVSVLFWFQIYAAWSSQYVFDYTYLLFYNTFFTLLPVIAIGLFDRPVDDHVLMALPSLYKPSREGTYFSMKLFLLYLFDGVVQSAIVYFIINYTYDTTSTRHDGWQPYIYEFGTVIAVSVVFVANFYNGLNTAAWTGWVFFAVALGIVIVLVYTAVYSALSPSLLSTTIYGNNQYLWPSPYFWLCIMLTVVLCLIPIYVTKAYKFISNTSDIDRVRWIHKLDPDHDFAQDRGTAISTLQIPTRSSRHVSTRRKRIFNANRTDMATGLRSTDRGFDFAMEDNGIALQRMQTNLSQHHQAKPKRRKPTLPHLSLPRSLRRKKAPPPDHDPESTLTDAPVEDQTDLKSSQPDS